MRRLPDSREDVGAGAGQIREESKVRQLLAAKGDLVVEANDAGGDGAELGQESFDEQASGFDDGGVRICSSRKSAAKSEDPRPSSAARVSATSASLRAGSAAKAGSMSCGKAPPARTDGMDHGWIVRVRT